MTWRKTIALLCAVAGCGCSQRSHLVLTEGSIHLPFELALESPFTARGSNTYVCVGIPAAIDTKGDPPYRTAAGREIEIRVTLTNDEGKEHALRSPMYLAHNKQEMLCVWEKTPHRETPREAQRYVKVAVSGTPNIAFEGVWIESMTWH